MTSVNSTNQYLQQGLTNPEYSIVLHKTYPTKKTPRICWLKGSSEARKEKFCRKAYYECILAFKLLIKFWLQF
jgi:hypothetical protein